jgi:predicted membrane protein
MAINQSHVTYIVAGLLLIAFLALVYGSVRRKLKASDTIKTSLLAVSIDELADLIASLQPNTADRSCPVTIP